MTIIEIGSCEQIGIHPLLLGEGAKRKPDRAQPQQKAEGSGFAETCDPHPARAYAPTSGITFSVTKASIVSPIFTSLKF